MRRVILGLAVAAFVTTVYPGWINPLGLAQAQPQATPAVKPLVLSDGMIALGSDLAERKQQVVVIDTKSRVMSVYHIDHATGVITLKSVRNLSADLMMDEFNTANPLPREIRMMLTK